MADITNGGASAFDSSMQARVAGRDILGKYDDHLPEVRIPFEVKQDAERAAREDGCGDLTAWIRALVVARLYGPSHMARLHEEQYARVLGNAGQGRPTVPVPDASLPPFLRGSTQP